MRYLSALCLFCLLIVFAACGGSSSSASGGGNNVTPPPTTPPPPPPPPPVTPPPTTSGSLQQSVNHVVILMQENRSFDHYFGDMTNYRQRNNIPIVTSTGDGKILDLTDPAAQGPASSNISPATGKAILPYQSKSACTEDLTPDWRESHLQANLNDPAAAGPGSPMNGFVRVAFNLGSFLQVLEDKQGRRAMSFFSDDILNFYYYMASNFAMSDMMFSPVPTRTSSNRLYIHAATSQGSVHADTSTNKQFTSKTIWRALDEKGVSWKIYITDWGVSNFTFFNFFTDSNDPARRKKIVSIDEYFKDLANGTLPSVAFIETGMQTGRDEHPTNNPGPGIAVPPNRAIHIQAGAAWSARLIHALMDSSSWKDSVFFFTFDEGGGAFDHVPPISVPNPDGITPSDLVPERGDCLGQPCAQNDFNITGFRVPNFIVSPFAKKNYVSHTPMDFTALLKFVETRFGLDPLTKRDAAMPDMTEFFDFTNGGPWAIPPARVEQRQDAACDFSKE